MNFSHEEEHYKRKRVLIQLFLDSFVETKGRTLEEINEIFEAPYPKKRSIQKHIVVVTDCGILDKGLEDC